ncbi:gamma-glutamyltranspeptidase [Clonorchis sinensis]|uniref:Gamma-glutamyltranspeptidase n=1 Tax=Clonorchis sinensis TaxID=79923 RepID=G7Y4D9_CLOSI|nr:gamma-glutamyltranspeptidase [Clonorchis sinensis]
MRLRQVSRIDRTSLRSDGGTRPEDITRIDAKKDLGIWLSPNVSFSLHLEKLAQRAFAVLRMIRRTFSRITRTDFQILYGAYVRPLLEYANPVVYSERTKHVILSERVQGAATQIVAGLKSVDYETRPAVLDLFPFEYRRPLMELNSYLRPVLNKAWPTGLAGCGMMLVQDRNTQKSHLYDFMCSAPSNPSVVDDTKPASLVGVPGFVRGLQNVHRNFGQRRWSDLFAGVLNLAVAGFRPDPNLLSAAKATAAAHPGTSGMIFNELAQFSGEIYHPPDALKDTLRNLKDNGEHYFYDTHSEPASFSSQLLSFLNPQGVHWQARDMSDYAVEKPKPIMMAFAGFTLEAFPSPSSGGSFLLSLLGNLWLKNLRVPLDPGALAKKVPNATATMLHRFIEFGKLSETQALRLGDINDNLIGAEAKAAQNRMLALESRMQTVDSVTDTRTFSPNAELLESPNFKIGDTGILTTDSNTLTVALSLFLGSPFGNGQYVPKTGVHLNAALKLFSTSSGPVQPMLNTIGPKRRPLVPISPIYLSTTHRKCGVRVGVTTSGGLWGTIDAAQIIADAALFLRSPPCTPPKGITTPVDDVAASTLLGNKQTSADQPTHMGYSPASDAGCLGFQASSGLPRLRSGPVVRNGSELSDPVSVEPKFDTNLATGLEGVGHKMSTVSGPWPGRVAVVGWNGYNIISSVDQRGSWNSAQF